jgi:peroxiredoxin
MPEWQALQEARGADGLRIVGISIDAGDENLRRFVEKKKVTYAIARDLEEAPAWEQFLVAAVPALFLVDQDGNIVRQWTGTVDAADVRSEVDRLLDVNGS